MRTLPFPTDKTESRKSAWYRFIMNFFVPFRRTGGRAVFVSGDFSEVHIRIKLNYWTRNYVGTLFGGSMYGALDPVYMIQLIMILGKGYVVWDKAASIKFKKPVRDTVFARFLLDEAILDDIRETVARDGRCNRDLPVNLVTSDGTVHAEIIKTLYIADRNYYEQHKKNAETAT